MLALASLQWKFQPVNCTVNNLSPVFTHHRTWLAGTPPMIFTCGIGEFVAEVLEIGGFTLVLAHTPPDIVHLRACRRRISSSNVPIKLEEFGDEITGEELIEETLLDPQFGDPLPLLLALDGPFCSRPHTQRPSIAPPRLARLKYPFAGAFRCALPTT